MRVRVPSLQRVQKSLTALMNENTSVSFELAQDIAQMIYDKSQELVPVDTGRLKESGSITELINDPINGYRSFAIHYEAYNPRDGYEYAPIQHENVEYNHTQGQVFYLAAAVDFDRIKNAMTDAYKGMYKGFK